MKDKICSMRVGGNTVWFDNSTTPKFTFAPAHVTLRRDTVFGALSRLRIALNEVGVLDNAPHMIDVDRADDGGVTIRIHNNITSR